MEEILVIEDERPTLTMFRLMLSAHGYTVLTAENGTDGLKVFEQKRPAIVLTDIKMPGMDGIEVLRRIKQIDPKTEVIVITGHGDMELAIKALNLDAADFINKPIQRHHLEEALERARERIRVHQSNERQVSVEADGDTAIIHFRGSLTSRSEAAMQEGFREAFALNKHMIILDFDRNISVNGAGISILTQLLLEAQTGGRPVRVTGLPEHFERVFRIVGIAGLVEIREPKDEGA